MAQAILYLEDGTFFIGHSLSTTGETSGEVVFNTAMTGYQEILTDPSYAGQFVTMTYPLIGNYGVNEEDVESSDVHLKGFVVKEFCRRHSNHRATQSLIDYLDEHKIMAIEGIDTRALTRHLREKGAMRAILSTEDLDADSLAKKMKGVPSMEGADWVQEVSTEEKYIWPNVVVRCSLFVDRKPSLVGDAYMRPLPGLRTTNNEQRTTKYKIAAIDCGIKFNILRILDELGCEVHVFPAKATADEIMAIEPDGLFVSNGPGDPAAVTYVIDTVRSLIGKLPIFGICLGHQIIGLALGGKTFKLKFGHHGANHPVKDLLDSRVCITSQNHGFCVDLNSLDQDDVELIDINLNDQTLEGIRHKRYPLLSFQHHPEAAPGPTDAVYLFGYFLDMMKKVGSKQ